MAINRNIKYLNKDFNEFKASLIDYTKTYFPTTYNDFSPASPGIMFIEMASYVGDVLSFYLDNQVQENYLQFARQSNNLFELAYMFGYKPKVTGVATADLDFYQTVPWKNDPSTGTRVPDFSYALYIAPNSTITNSSNVSFLLTDPVDFSVSSSSDPTVVTIYDLSGLSNPNNFLLKKTRKVISATINTVTFPFTSPVKFSTVEINANNLVGILDCVDSEGNQWYEVDYLGQEMVYDSIKNTNYNDPNLSLYSDAPYLLKLKKTQYRFTTRLRNSNTLQIQFGSGTANNSDETIIPNPDNVGIGLPFEQDKLNTAYAPSNFLFTKTYGIAPSNTTLTIRYLTGGGVAANVDANTLTQLNGTVNFLNSNLTPATAQSVFNSLAVTNPTAANGGGDGDTIEEIRQNSIVNFASQQRIVTQDDYLVRTLSMPARYGNIAKAYIEPTKLRNIPPGESTSVMDLYVLSYDISKKLTVGSLALKQNLATYLSQYRIITDSINIKDAFIINIGVNFDIIVLPNYNNNQVLTQCVSSLQNYFNIENWQINQPIILRDVYVLLDNIDGVQTVKNIEISNFVGTALGYSAYAYDIPGATQNNIVYPSIDPMIFEVKYPESDIQGRIVPL